MQHLKMNFVYAIVVALIYSIIMFNKKDFEKKEIWKSIICIIFLICVPALLSYFVLYSLSSLFCQAKYTSFSNIVLDANTFSSLLFKSATDCMMFITSLLTKKFSKFSGLSLAKQYSSKVWNSLDSCPCSFFSFFHCSRFSVCFISFSSLFFLLFLKYLSILFE